MAVFRDGQNERSMEDVTLPFVVFRETLCEENVNLPD